MLVRIDIIKKNLAYVIIFLIGNLFIAYNPSIISHIVVFILYCFYVMYSVKFDICHPLCWFTGFFCLYSVSFPILKVFGYSTVNYTSELMHIQLLALFIFHITVSPNTIKMKSNNNSLKNDFYDLGIFNKLIYVLLQIIVILAVVYVSRVGYFDKDEIYANGNTFLKFSFRCPLIITILYCIFTNVDIENKGFLSRKRTIFTGGILVLITLFSGERDFVFRYIIILTLILWYHRYIKFMHLLIIGFTLILLLPISTIYKYYFLNGQKYMSNNPIVYNILSGEFESASKNLQIILNSSENMKGIMGIGYLGKEVASVFLSTIVSSQKWYNNIFFPMSKVQYGFSLVADGYIMAGYFGVIFLFFIIGLIVKIFYKHSNEGPFSLTAYFYLITVVIYAIRGDFAVILSAIEKQIFIVLLIIYLMKNLSVKKLK